MRVCWLLCSAVLLTACVSNFQVQGEPAGVSLEQARERWRAEQLGSYEYEIVRQCYCTPEYTRPMRVSVRENVVVAARYSDDRSPVPAAVVKSLRSIDGWFDHIAQGYKQGYFRMQIDYHSQQGYPQELFMDRREQVADDEETVRIKLISASMR